MEQLMKYFLFLIIFFLNTAVNAQWVQTNLGDAQYGYNLYSSANELYAATLNGVYSTTTNSDTWLSLGLNNRLVIDVIKSNQYILAATESTGPGVFRSSDNGSTWTEANGIANQSVRAFTKNSSYLFACTWGGGIFRSNDDGANWQSVGLTNAGFRSIYAAGEIIFAGADKIYFSNNNGDTWESRQLPYPAGDTWCFYYANGRVYAGDMGLYSSADLGNTWKLEYGVTFDGQGNASDIKIFKDIVSYNNVLLASVAFNSILISKDGGKSWNSFSEGLFPDWTFSGIVINAPYIWTLRDFFGNAYKRPVSELVTDVNDRENVNYDFTLRQNYPNPFNPVTKISWQSPVSSWQILKIYDLLGNEVGTLVDEYKEAGSYEIEFDAKSLASGVYYYELKTENYTAGKKMVILK
jgi:hypothetical protein